MPKNSRMSLFEGWKRMINPLAMKAYDEYYKGIRKCCDGKFKYYTCRARILYK